MGDCHSSRNIVTYILKQPTQEHWPGQPVPLFGLASNGACLARYITITTGRLLLHRFTLTTIINSGGLLSVALAEDHSSWVLPSVLPYEARTFLSINP